MMKVKPITIQKAIPKAIPIRIKLYDAPGSPEVYALGFAIRDEIPESLIDNPNLFIYALIGTERRWPYGVTGAPVDYLVAMEQVPANGEIFSFERLGAGEWKFAVQELENAEIKKISEKYDILCDVFDGFYSDRE